MWLRYFPPFFRPSKTRPFGKLIIHPPVLDPGPIRKSRMPPRCLYPHVCGFPGAGLLPKAIPAPSKRWCLNFKWLQKNGTIVLRHAGTTAASLLEGFLKDAANVAAIDRNLLTDLAPTFQGVVSWSVGFLKAYMRPRTTGWKHVFLWTYTLNETLHR